MIKNRGEMVERGKGKSELALVPTRLGHESGGSSGPKSFSPRSLTRIVRRSRASIATTRRKTRRKSTDPRRRGSVGRWSDASKAVESFPFSLR